MRDNLKKLLKAMPILALTIILLGKVNIGKITVPETPPSETQEETYSPMDDSDEESNRETNGC